MPSADTAAPIEQLGEQLNPLNDRIAEAVVALSGDTGASPVTRVVFEQLLRKSEDTLTCIECGRHGCLRERIIELEQAAEAARAAAVADEGATEATQERILTAYEALRELRGVIHCGLNACALVHRPGC